MCLIGIWQLAIAGKFYAKAWLAEQLIERAWTSSLQEDTQEKPWPWADTWPVAELSIPRLGIDEIVLSGDSGRVLAFGPGLTESSSLPGQPGLSIISGHRDTHFEFLQDIKMGDKLVIRSQQGSMNFIIEETAIVDQRDFRVNRELLTEKQHSQMMLVTCYPFNALTSGGDLRFIVIAKSQNNVI